jgi:hypothetical protein
MWFDVSKAWQKHTHTRGFLTELKYRIELGKYQKAEIFMGSQERLK